MQHASSASREPGQVRMSGVTPALLTPLTPDGSAVDEDSLRRLCDFVIEGGVRGLYPCGTNGEGPLLTSTERQRVVEVALAQAAGRVPVFVQVGAVGTVETVELARHARAAGAAGAGVVTPYYYQYDDEALLRHHVAVAEALAPLPLYLYNIPQNTGHNLSPALVGRIAAAAPNVVGIKNSTADLAETLAFLRVRPGFAVISGNDALAGPALLMGCAGLISGNANVAPRLLASLVAAAEAGDPEQTRTLQRQLDALRSTLARGLHVPNMKAVLARQGVIASAAMRAPQRASTPEEAAAAWEVLQAAGLV
jgi:4-hydroxy-tetrahydrodipicolinate synthase